MLITKERADILHNDIVAIHVITRMLLNNFKSDPRADEEGNYEGVIEGIYNLTAHLEQELFEIKKGFEDE